MFKKSKNKSAVLGYTYTNTIIHSNPKVALQHPSLSPLPAKSASPASLAAPLASPPACFAAYLSDSPSALPQPASLRCVAAFIDFLQFKYSDLIVLN